MGLFKRKKKEPVRDWKLDAIEAMELWRPIGGHFKYLGRDCVVSGHYTSEYWPQLGPMLRVVLRADYADDHGVIREIALSHAEAAAIMAEQP